MTLGELLEERGLSSDEAAAILAEHGITITQGARFGEHVSAADVTRRKGKQIPKAWYSAFGLEASELPPAPGSEQEPPGEGTDGQRARREAPPRRPKEARIEPAMLEPGARKRIAGAYKFAGAALAAGAGSNGVAEVWADQADPIAELWIAAAQDNPWAAKFVNMMSAGGAGGDLAAAHLYLVGATFYVLGAGIPGGDAIFAKYSRHRPPTPPPVAKNGHGPQDSSREKDASPSPTIVDDPSIA